MPFYHIKKQTLLQGIIYVDPPETISGTSSMLLKRGESLLLRPFSVDTGDITDDAVGDDDEAFPSEISITIFPSPEIGEAVARLESLVLHIDATGQTEQIRHNAVLGDLLVVTGWTNNRGRACVNGIAAVVAAPDPPNCVTTPNTPCKSHDDCCRGLVCEAPSGSVTGGPALCTVTTHPVAPEAPVVDEVANHGVVAEDAPFSPSDTETGLVVAVVAVVVLVVAIAVAVVRKSMSDRAERELNKHRFVANQGTPMEPESYGESVARHLFTGPHSSSGSSDGSVAQYSSRHIRPYPTSRTNTAAQLFRTPRMGNNFETRSGRRRPGSHGLSVPAWSSGGASTLLGRLDTVSTVDTAPTTLNEDTDFVEIPFDTNNGLTELPTRMTLEAPRDAGFGRMQATTI